MTTTAFRLKRQASGTVDTDLFDVDPVQASFNKFASGAVCLLFDDDGAKKDSYPYFQRADIEYTTDGGSTWNSWLSTIVVERSETVEEGPQAVRLGMVSHDHLLRRETVERSFSSTTISSILETIIKNDTSVGWNASKVNVQNDQTITREFKGIKVDEAIDYLASRSADEEYGVDSSLDFTFDQQTINRADPITDADVISHDLPEKGERAINSYQIYWGANEDNVETVNDREAQQDLKDKLGAGSRVILREKDSFPEISNQEAAEALARQRLNNRSVLQTGVIRIPLGRFDISPGDVFSLTISDAGINSVDFRAASVKHFWKRGETELKIAENVAGDISDLLVELSDQLVNARLRNIDTSATETEYLDIRSGITMSVSAALTAKTAGSGFTLGQSQLGQGSSDQLGGSVSSTSSVSVESKKVTRALLNMARDVWQGEAATDLTHLSAGTDGTEATVSDNSLQSQVSRVSLDKFGAGDAAEKFEFVGTVPAGGIFADAADIQELGISNAATGNNHYLRLTIADTTVDASTRLKVHIEVTVETDSDEQGVVTSKGQERWRDLLIGETNHEPTDFAYGTGTTAFTESDTALGSKQHEDTIDSTEDRATGICLLIEKITAGDANTNGFAEVSTENAANEMLSALQFEALTADKIFQTNWEFIATNA